MNSRLPMVGVGRIELPTPAMSTQQPRARTADFCGFRVPHEQNIAGISSEHRPFTPQRHRNVEVAGA
jgi:hypothetical protein